MFYEPTNSTSYDSYNRKNPGIMVTPITPINNADGTAGFWCPLTESNCQRMITTPESQASNGIMTTITRTINYVKDYDTLSEMAGMKILNIHIRSKE